MFSIFENSWFRNYGMSQMIPMFICSIRIFYCTKMTQLNSNLCLNNLMKLLFCIGYSLTRIMYPLLQKKYWILRKHLLHWLIKTYIETMFNLLCSLIVLVLFTYYYFISGFWIKNTYNKFYCCWCIIKITSLHFKTIIL